MEKKILITASLFGFLSLLIGAFGAHGLQQTLDSFGRTETFSTAIDYQFYHVFLLFFFGIFYKKNPRIISAGFYSCIVGIFLFSGSLYVLCLTNNPFWGMVTPFGGFFLMISWLLLLFSLKKS